ncbi:hypothetical protein BDK51DRAFT_38588 [Blyttiomyces helicus]|uniref:Uncharacterized protein n=1 Tax=Blyttiomyces helicus TaxID=388810 RepID=A0A4V1IQY8_9FUNG|nr:hypothetical protein BDK51DRAFT_38588 [Blyttiomyces helicus]|eukprot:RKO88207.1 hypothetical protein BDK51DRAFT_38588 [Blyttiomyces helicus]
MGTVNSKGNAVHLRLLAVPMDTQHHSGVSARTGLARRTEAEECALTGFEESNISVEDTQAVYGAANSEKVPVEWLPRAKTELTPAPLHLPTLTPGSSSKPVSQVPAPSVAEPPLATPRRLLQPLRMPEILRRAMQTFRSLRGRLPPVVPSGLRGALGAPPRGEMQKAGTEPYYCSDSSDSCAGGRPTNNAPIDFDNLAASTHVSLLGGPPLGNYLRILDICMNGICERFDGEDVVERFTGFHCPRLRALGPSLDPLDYPWPRAFKWGPSLDPLEWLLPTFAILFFACPDLVALADPLDGIEDTFWMSDEGREADEGVACLQVLRLECGWGDSNCFHRALGPNLLQWRGPPSHKDHFNILDQCPNLTPVVDFSFEYDRKKPLFALPRGKRYPTVKAIFFRSHVVHYSPAERDSIVASLLQTFPGIAHFNTHGVDVTSALFPALTAHRPHARVCLHLRVLLIPFFRYAVTDALLDALSSACSRLVYIDFGIEPVFTEGNPLQDVAGRR